MQRDGAGLPHSRQSSPAALLAPLRQAHLSPEQLHLQVGYSKGPNNMFHFESALLGLRTCPAASAAACLRRACPHHCV